MSINLYNNKVIINDDGEVELDVPIYWHYNYIDISQAVVSGTTYQAPDGNSLGGYRLDRDVEYIYFNSKVFTDWDGASDLEVVVFWELNADNSGGGVDDTVDLKLSCDMKGVGEITPKNQTSEEVTIVGQSLRYKQFETTFVLDYNDGSNPVDADDLMSFVLNLETDTSEVDDIIINFVIFRYKTKLLGIKII